MTMATPFIDSLAQVASKVIANKRTLEQILSDLKTDDPNYIDKNFALNSILGSAEYCERVRKSEEVTA